MKKRKSPTRPPAPPRAQKSPDSRSRTNTPPTIYVETPSPQRPGDQIPTWSARQKARAHLRNKRGYVYLCWREGKRIRNLYLGKAPRKSPTRPPAPAVARADQLPRSRRARKEPK